jgi:hypothetical protein
MVAIWVLLELHATCPVRFTVVAEEVVPMARNWVVCVGEATDWDPGMMASETMVDPVVPEVDPGMVTVMSEVAVIPPDSAMTCV